jgi:hypothetical protein
MQLIFICLSSCISLYAAEDVQLGSKQHSLDDERIRKVVLSEKDGGYSNYLLPPCTNIKLSRPNISLNLSDTKPIAVPHKIYIDLIARVRQSDRDNASGFDSIMQYLDEGYTYQTTRAILFYYSPLIYWVAWQIGVGLPKECCEKMASYINELPKSAPCKIFKAEAMIMLRYAFYAFFAYVTNNHRSEGYKEYYSEGYKEYYQFPAALNALW